MAEEKPDTHKTLIVRIDEILPHTNADRLELVRILGYQAVSQKGAYKVGDLAVYIQPDSIVPEQDAYAFLWLPHTYEGGVPVRKRRIGAKKLRGEWSEGLLMPISILGSSYDYPPGTDVSDLLGITHYNPEEKHVNAPSTSSGQKKYPKSFRGWLAFAKGWLKGDRREFGPAIPTYDVKAFKNYSKAFTEEDFVVVTEKIHGSNGRFIYDYPVVKGWLGWLKGKLNIKEQQRFYVGSRNLWKAFDSKCVWRAIASQYHWIEGWCMDHPGYALYGEAVSASTQKGFHYGCKGAATKFFLFDILKPNGQWADWEEVQRLLEGYDAQGILVPILYVGRFDPAKILKLVDGQTAVAQMNTLNDDWATPVISSWAHNERHIREGIVIKTYHEKHIPGVGRAQLKIVSNAYYEKNSKE